MGKTVVRTESAPAPFQGAPYSQAIVAGGLVFAVAARAIGILRGDDADWLRRHTSGGRTGPAVDVVASWLSRAAPARGEL